MNELYQGVTTYNPYQALEAIDANIAIIAIGMIVSLGLTMLYFYEAIRLGNKHKTFSSPLVATLWFLPHDLSFVLLYDKWFNVYNHWWCKIWWIGLVFTVLIELYLIYQIIRFGREEIMPEKSQSYFMWSIIAATIGASVIWFVIKSGVSDELFFISFFFTIVWPIPFTTAQILRRKSQRGMSVLQLSILIPMMAGLYFALCNISDYFLSPLFISLVAISMIWAAYNVVLLKAQPIYKSAV